MLKLMGHKVLDMDVNDKRIVKSVLHNDLLYI